MASDHSSSSSSSTSSGSPHIPIGFSSRIQPTPLAIVYPGDLTYPIDVESTENLTTVDAGHQKFNPVKFPSCRSKRIFEHQVESSLPVQKQHTLAKAAVLPSNSPSNPDDSFDVDFRPTSSTTISSPSPVAASAETDSSFTQTLAEFLASLMWNLLANVGPTVVTSSPTLSPHADPVSSSPVPSPIFSIGIPSPPVLVLPSPVPSPIRSTGVPSPPSSVLLDSLAATDSDYDLGKNPIPKFYFGLRPSLWKSLCHHIILVECRIYIPIFE